MSYAGELDDAVYGSTPELMKLLALGYPRPGPHLPRALARTLHAKNNIADTQNHMPF